MELYLWFYDLLKNENMNLKNIKVLIIFITITFISSCSSNEDSNKNSNKMTFNGISYPLNTVHAQVEYMNSERHVVFYMYTRQKQKLIVKWFNRYYRNIFYTSSSKYIRNIQDILIFQITKFQLTEILLMEITPQELYCYQIMIWILMFSLLLHCW